MVLVPRFARLVQIALERGYSDLPDVAERHESAYTNRRIGKTISVNSTDRVGPKRSTMHDSSHTNTVAGHAQPQTMP